LLENHTAYVIDDITYASQQSFEMLVISKIKEADAFVAEENFGGKKLGIQVALIPELGDEKLHSIVEKLKSFNAAAIELEVEQTILENRELHLLVQPDKLEYSAHVIFELYSFPKQ
jgi:hypothetical protein